MFEITVKGQFNSAHQIRDYGGKCEELHGHNWLVEARVTKPDVADDGMVIDFAVLKKQLNIILDDLDHKFINDLEPFKTINPTSENMARHIYQRLSDMINDNDVKVSSVSVWETDTSCATYSE
jgi:6-pyruvoyltetrahydropterin/6-carboxytetrahydropterin synthase